MYFISQGNIWNCFCDNCA